MAFKKVNLIINTGRRIGTIIINKDKKVTDIMTNIILNIIEEIKRVLNKEGK